MDEIQRRAAPIARQIAERLEGTGCPSPRLGMILGSGWGAAAERMDVSVRLPFAHLEGMPACGVPGHAAQGATAAPGGGGCSGRRSCGLSPPRGPGRRRAKPRTIAKQGGALVRYTNFL